MKITWFLILFLSQSMFGQVQISNMSLTDSTLPIAYIGIDNRIMVTGVKPGAKIDLSTSNGTLSKYDYGYILHVSSIDTIIITVKVNNQSSRKTFFCKTIDKPIAKLGNVKDTIASIKEILLNPFLRIVIENCYWNYRYAVTAFNATFIKGYDSTLTEASGSIFTEEQIKFTKQLEPGDRIYFSSIYALGADDRTQHFKNFVIIVK